MSIATLRRRAQRESWLLRYATPARIPFGWQDHAACKGVEMFPPTLTGVLPAVATCQTCPVRLDCLHDAFADEAGVNTNHIFGIRGGLSATARRGFLEAHPEVRPHRQEATA